MGLSLDLAQMVITARYPESIFIKDNNLFIPNMGNSKLFKVDLLTKQMDLLMTFEEKIWQYAETDIGTFIVTDTGIYELENDNEEIASR